MNRPGARSLDATGAVGKQAETGHAPLDEPGEPVRRRNLTEQLYQANMEIAGSLKRQEKLVADLDDDQLSGCLWALQMAVLGFDRELRRRR